MNIIHLKNGNLEMSADVNEQEEIKKILNFKFMTPIAQEAAFITDYLGGDPMGDGKSYEQVAPEEVGALTSAPIISDGENVYGYMNYQIDSFLEELAAGQTITWQKG